jgi:translation elongation factor EF-1beta
LNKNLQTIINDIINELNENKDLNEVGFGLKYLKSKTLFFFIYNNQQNI